MRKVLLILFVFFGFMYSQNTNWSLGTAYSLKQGQWETGLFQPLRYGINNNMDVAVHPFLAAIIPNVMIKRTREKVNDWTIATRHSAYYPTPLLQSITGSGKFKIVSGQFEFPSLIGINNDILATKNYGAGLITAKVGLLLGFGGSDLNSLSTIDVPLVYPRLAVYYNGWGLRFGADYNKTLSGKWSGFIDGDLFLYPGSKHGFFYESKILLIWSSNSQFRVMVGYKITYGKYPFGNHWQIVPPQLPTLPKGLPLIDIQISW